MPGAELEPTIPVFERAKTIHALDLAATVIGVVCLHTRNFNSILSTAAPPGCNWKRRKIPVGQPDQEERYVDRSILCCFIIRRFTCCSGNKNSVCGALLIDGSLESSRFINPSLCYSEERGESYTWRAANISVV
jgi:hypothetical protein